jgi:hypothetical protein
LDPMEALLSCLGGRRAKPQGQRVFAQIFRQIASTDGVADR